MSFTVLSRSYVAALTVCEETLASDLYVFTRHSYNTVKHNKSILLLIVP